MSDTYAFDDIAIHRIVEMEGAMPESGYHPLSFFPTLKPEQLEENRAWLTGNGLDPVHGHVVMCYQSYVVRTPHHTILIDSCIGNDKERSGRSLWNFKSDAIYMQRLAAAGLALDDIDIVMCTHLHADHVGWNTRLDNGRWVPTFPNARYLFTQAELDHVLARHDEEPLAYVADSVLPVIEAGRADLVRSDHVLDDHIRLDPTPGHTPDHFAVHAVGRGGGRALFAGDLIHSPLQMRYPELSMRADWDGELAAKTRRRVLEQCCEDGALMCSAHFPSPSVGHCNRQGMAFEFKLADRPKKAA